MFLFYRYINKSAIIDKRSPHITLFGAFFGLVYLNALLHFSPTLMPGLEATLPGIIVFAAMYYAFTLYIYSYIMRVIYLLLADYVNIRQGAVSGGDLSSGFDLDDRKNTEVKEEKKTWFQVHRQKNIAFRINILIFLLRFRTKRDEKGRLLLTKNIYSNTFLLKTTLYVLVIITIIFGATFLGVKDRCPDLFTASYEELSCKSDIMIGFTILNSIFYYILGDFIMNIGSRESFFCFCIYH